MRSVEAPAASSVVVIWLLRSFSSEVCEAQFMEPVSTVRPMAAKSSTMISA